MEKAIVRRMISADLFADDLVQEAMLQAYLSLDTLTDSNRFRSWLYGITRNLCLMFLRVQRIQSISLEFLVDTGSEPFSPKPSPEEVAERLELRRLIHSYIEQLSPANREIVLLFYYENFDLQETAAALAISVNTAKGRLYRARNHLQELLITSEAIRQGENNMIPVKIVDVVIREVPMGEDQIRKLYQLVLMSEAQRRAFVIWVGEYEGLAIAYKLNGYETPRPITQTFIVRLIEASGAKLERIEISELKKEVFYAIVHLNIDGILKQVDSRPSDAIPLAIYTDTPMFVSPQVLSEQGFDVPEKYTPNGKGVAEILENVEALAKADAAHRERVKGKPEFRQLRDLEHEAQILFNKVFEPTD
jgi:RNA polymerase sigma factor (sigma-70 family)